MTSIIYEHPLNEKVRTYLRVEYLFQQVTKLLPLETEWQQQGFFTSLFALIEVLERNDVRPDLIKDVERCESALVNWQSDLLRCGKFAASLKEDKFLAPLRQRFFIPGGTCYFDLPQLQFWFSQPLAQRKKAAQEWLDQLFLVETAIGYVLTFIRERGQFQDLTAENGFFQSNTEQFELLRIDYSMEYQSYPTISGNRYRYAIRFMQLCDSLGRTTIDKAIPFKLACC
jgi:cell division protein ZapD